MENASGDLSRIAAAAELGAEDAVVVDAVVIVVVVFIVVFVVFMELSAEP